MMLFKQEKGVLRHIPRPGRMAKFYSKGYTPLKDSQFYANSWRIDLNN